MIRQKLLPGLVVLLLMSGPALAVTIDTFDQGPMSLVLTAVGTTTDTVTGLNVIGGTRTMTLDVDFFGPSQANADVLVNSGVLYWNEDDGIRGSLTLNYSGSEGTPWDLTDGTTTHGILFGFQSDNHPWKLHIAVSDGVNTSTYDATVGSIGNYVWGTYFAPYSGFSGTANLASAQDLTIEFNSDFADGAGGDYSFDIIQTAIPEPVTMAGLLMGVGGLAGYFRKRRLV